MGITSGWLTLLRNTSRPKRSGVRCEAAARTYMSYREGTSAYGLAVRTIFTGIPSASSESAFGGLRFEYEGFEDKSFRALASRAPVLSERKTFSVETDRPPPARKSGTCDPLGVSARKRVDSDASST